MARLKKASGHAGALAQLADQDDWLGGSEIVEARLDLVHRDVYGAGNVGGGEFGRGADVDELGVGATASQVRDGDGWGQSSSYLKRAGDCGKGFKVESLAGLYSARRALVSARGTAEGGCSHGPC